MTLCERSVLCAMSTIFVALAGLAAPAFSQTPSSRANLSGYHDAPFLADPEVRTSEKRSGSALFSNDCPMNQKMYVTLQKNYGRVDLIVLPNKSTSTHADRGDKFAARCGVVVARNAKFNWIKLSGSGD